MFLLIATALVGGVAGMGMLWPYLGLLAFVVAPFAASLLTLFVGAYMAWRGVGR
jgi:hypothetical protein